GRAHMLPPRARSGATDPSGVLWTGWWRTANAEPRRRPYAEPLMEALSHELVAGRFQVEREVGRGGVGIVYRAFDTLTHQHVALKIIATQGADDAEHIRFPREGHVLSELDHPRIVRVVAFGALESSSVDIFGRTLEAGAPFVAMEWLDGEDL